MLDKQPLKGLSMLIFGFLDSNLVTQNSNRPDIIGVGHILVNQDGKQTLAEKMVT
jgi:hypothetical protein